jgi:hypothetical protein
MRPILAVSLLTAGLLVPAIPAQATILDATCVASIDMYFDPPAAMPITPGPGPESTVTGAGAISLCVVSDGGAVTGTLSYEMHGNLTCTSAQNITGVVDVAWAGGQSSHATVTTLLISLGSAGGVAGLTATVTSGRFTGDIMQIANLRDPLALVACLTTGLAHASGTTSLTFVEPLT